MGPTLFILDESGDLGWNFDRPYRAGGSSRHLTVSALIVPGDRKQLPKRIIKRMHEKCGWPADVEKKASEFSDQQCLDFAGRLAALVGREAGIAFKALTVKKQNVEPHIRADSNKLYNYMTKLLIGDEIAACDWAIIMPDERSIKVRSGNSLLDYLSIDQWFERKTKVKIDFTPQASKANLNVRVVDAIAHIVFTWHEDGADHGYGLLQAKGSLRTLFF